MQVSFDPRKDADNRHNHGISLARAEDFDFASALFKHDDREDYGEVRFRTIGFLDGKLYALVFSPRGEDVRAISLQKATKQEERDYAEEQ